MCCRHKDVPGNADSLVKAKARDGESEPHWELIATSPEELTELGERLRRSKKKPDQTLADQVCPGQPPLYVCGSRGNYGLGFRY